VLEYFHVRYISPQFLKVWAYYLNSDFSELHITLLSTRSNHLPLIIISMNSYKMLKYLVKCIWEYLLNNFSFTRQHSSRSTIWRTQWMSSKILKKKKFTTKFEKAVDVWVAGSPHALSLDYSSLHLSHTTIVMKGVRGWRCYKQLPLLGWSRVRTPVRVSHYCSVVCHGHPDLQPPSQTTPPWCNIQPSYTPPPITVGKIYWGGNDIWKGEEGAI